MLKRIKQARIDRLASRIEQLAIRRQLSTMTPETIREEIDGLLQQYQAMTGRDYILSANPQVHIFREALKGKAGEISIPSGADDSQA